MGWGSRGVILPALAGSDEHGTGLAFERVVTLLCGNVKIEGRVGCRPGCLREEGRR